MKIKTKKKMRLDELIKYVFDNGITGKRFEERLDYKSYSITHAVHVTGNGVMNVEGLFNPDTKFTVEVEEELTEETEIHGATFVYYDELKREIKPFRYADVTSPTLKHIIQPRSGTVALAVFKGKQLIWTKESGIPESGVLERD